MPDLEGRSLALELAGQVHEAAQVAGKQEIKVRQISPAYWRVTLHNPPFNIFGPETIPQLNEVITAIVAETDDVAQTFAGTSDAVGDIHQLQITIAASVEQQAAVLADVTAQLSRATAAADEVLAGLDRLAAQR